MELITASYRTWRPGTGSPVVTSLTVPRWKPEAAAWPRCWELTPRWAYFKAEPAEFDASAYEAPSDRLVLICWEADPARCHRSQFSSWLLETTGELVPELPT